MSHARALSLPENLLGIKGAPCGNARFQFAVNNVKCIGVKRAIFCGTYLRHDTCVKHVIRCVTHRVSNQRELFMQSIATKSVTKPNK